MFSGKAISDFFNNLGNDSLFTPISKGNYQKNYTTSNIDLILQRARRNKSVRENKIFDFIHVENDPNYNRSVYETNSGNKLTNMLGKISLVTQKVTMLNSLIYMLKIQEFLPSNVLSILQNFQAISDTNVNLLSNINELVTFGAIERAFFSDLSFNFMGNEITFRELTQFGLGLEEISPVSSNVKNTGLRGLLSLGLDQFLPSEFSNLFDTFRWIDDSYGILKDTNISSIFTFKTKEKVQRYINTTNMSDIVRDTNIYTNSDITLEDPLGINLQNSFSSEIIDNSNIEFAKIIDEVSNEMNLALSLEDKEALTTIIKDSFSKSVSESFGGGNGFPNMMDVVDAVNGISYNNTISSIKNAINNVINQIISDAGLKPSPSNVSPLDYLQNIKKNIDARAMIFMRGGSSSMIDDLDKEIRKSMNLSNISDKDINNLQLTIDNLLKERSEL